MTMTKTKDGKKLTISVEGRLDTLTAPELEKALESEIGGIDLLVLDLGKLEYISSAGLRVILGAHKKMLGKEGLRLCGLNQTVREIFDVTGFSDILTIE